MRSSRSSRAVIGRQATCGLLLAGCAAMSVAPSFAEEVPQASGLDSAPVRLAQLSPTPATSAPPPNATSGTRIDPGVLQLPTVDVLGRATLPENTLQRATGVSRLPGTVQNTPQAITVVPGEVLQQQNATTLDQALRNVPGITVSIGEGNGGVNGDQFKVRGFNAQNDIYVDGLRDFGSYTRDAFHVDSVQVLKGPSALTFGPGNVGGAINTTSRLATTGNFGSVLVSAGLGELYRVVGDYNRQVSDSVAVRLGVMGNYNRVVDRDVVDSARWGVAGSVTVGLNSPVTWTLDYLHQSARNTPDYGVPLVAEPGSTVLRPVTEFGVRRSTFYGINSDHDDTDVDRFTSLLRWQVMDGVVLHNDTRISHVNRSFQASPPSCASTGVGNCVSYLFDNNPRTVPLYTIGGGYTPFSQETVAVQNIFSVNADARTGPLRHQIVAGIDVQHQYDARDGFSFSSGRTVTGNLFDPDHIGGLFTSLPATGATASRRINTDVLGVFLTDRVYLNDTVSVLGGFRFNHFTTDYTTFGPGIAPATIKSDTSVIDPRASLIYEPTPNQTYYFSYGQSTQSPGQFIATLPATFTVGNAGLDPERATIYEVGAKYGLFNGRLGLTGSLFRIEKSNSVTVDGVTGVVTSSGDQQRVQGIELGVTGKITPNWTVNATYTYLDPVTTSSTTPANIGKQVTYTPTNSASLFTTYDIAKETPYNLTVGAGVFYRSKVFLAAAGTAVAPDSLSFDALLQHRINDKFTLQVNGYNLTNRLNYDAVFGNRATPASGRTVTFSLLTNF